EGSSEEECTEIDTNADFLDNSLLFHVVKDVLGFDMSLEFDTLQTDYKELTGLAQPDLKASFRRQQLGRMREVKRGIRRLEKLVKTIGAVDTALQMMITRVHGVEEVILILGGSPLRPQFVYQLCFSRGNAVPGGHDAGDFIKSRAAQGLSRKAIRTLISMGAGSGAYPGPTKLFLLVKAPSSFSLPLHFLPKRDFKYNKKISPYRLRLKCKCPDFTCQTSCSSSLKDSMQNDLIWFQCRHVVKGLAFKIPTEE
ncbi:hypothetical protein Tsubulata_039771, partial [Turnera subulata]